MAKSLTFPVPHFIFIKFKGLTFKEQRRPGPASLPVFMEYRQTRQAQGPRPPCLWASGTLAGGCVGRRLRLRAEAFRPPAFLSGYRCRVSPSRRTAAAERRRSSPSPALPPAPHREAQGLEASEEDTCERHAQEKCCAVKGPLFPSYVSVASPAAAVSPPWMGGGSARAPGGTPALGLP